MNSHERRVVERYRSHSINVSYDDDRYSDIIEWLNKNFGSCEFKRKKSPRWCWRPDYMDMSGFAMMCVGTQLFFHKEKDYMAFLLRWGGA